VQELFHDKPDLTKPKLGFMDQVIGGPFLSPNKESQSTEDHYITQKSCGVSLGRHQFAR